MISLDTLTWLVKASPTLIYLAGVIFLYLRLEKVQRENVVSLNAVIERYHEQVRQGVETLTLLNEKLEK